MEKTFTNLTHGRLKCLLTLIAVFCVSGAWADEEDDVEDTNLHWSFNEASGKLTITNKTTTPEEMPGYEAPFYDPENPDCIANVAPWSECNVKSVEIGANITKIGAYSFYYKDKLTTVILSDDVTTIGEEAFVGCEALKTVSMPKVTTIEDYAFNGCKAMTSVSIPEVTTIREGAFSECSSLETVSMPKTTTIGTYAFEKCSAMTSVSIPEVTTIREGAFRYCSSLETVSMPKVTTIGGYVFRYCSSLKTVTLGTCPAIGGDAFTNTSSGLTATVNLTDDSYVGTSADNYPSLSAASTYTRQLADDQTMGTLILPFAVKNNSSDYTLGYVSEASIYGITVSDYEEGEEIPAGTPVLFKAKTAGAELTFTASGTSLNLSRDFTSSSKAENWTMKGTYEAVSSGNASVSGGDQVYYISTDDTFYYANQDFPCNAFRGWLVTSEQRPASSSAAKARLAIRWDDEETGVKDVNDVVSASRCGKYIENGRVVIVKNNKKFNISGQEVK